MSLISSVILSINLLRECRRKHIKILSSWDTRVKTKLNFRKGDEFYRGTVGAFPTINHPLKYCEVQRCLTSLYVHSTAVPNRFIAVLKAFSSALAVTLGK